MKHDTYSSLGILLALIAVTAVPGSALAQQHRATLLGNPSTRFAPPLQTPADLRARFSDPALQPDIAAILDQWGWTGNLDDLLWAGRTNEITEVELPPGTRMPFMSSRKNGKPITLRDVLWDGNAPVSAYAFTFRSKGRGYRCVTPKPCSNFYLEDLGAPLLELTCDAPAEVLASRSVQVCFTLRNNGDAAEPKTVVSLPVPTGVEYVSPTKGKLPDTQALTWEIADLSPGDARLLCANFTTKEPGSLSFAPAARGELAGPAQTACETRVIGIAGILLEVVDVADPIEVGKEVTYEIRVTNQGTATGTNIRLVCTLPPSQEFVSGEGTTAVQAQAASVTTESLASLAPKAAASWRVVVKAAQAADARFRVELASDQFQTPIEEVESTQQY